jgi:hypothetical protein
MHFCITETYVTGETAKNKRKHPRENFQTELNKMNANKSEDPGLSWKFQWRLSKVLLFF